MPYHQADDNAPKHDADKESEVALVSQNELTSKNKQAA
jgi:hypothetical protein